MKFRILSIKSLCLGLFLSVGASFLCTTSCSAYNLTQNASSVWFGFGNANSSTNTGYVYETGWFDGYSRTFAMPSANFAPNNLSASTRITITDDMISSGGKLTFSGTARVGLRLQFPNQIFFRLPSSYQIFNGNVFGLGIDPSQGIYDATVRVTSTVCYPYPNSTGTYLNYGNVQCDINFTATEPGDWSSIRGQYWLSWRLNGNSTSNGGKGSFWGGFAGSRNTTGGAITITDFASSISIDFGDNSGGGNDNSELLNQLAQQNNTIIGQNQQIISGISDVKDQLQQNQQQQHQDAQNQLEETQKTNDYLMSDEEPSVDFEGGLSGASGWLPAGPVDSLVTLPAQFLSGVVSAFTGDDNCQPVSATLPFIHKDIEIPCMRPIFERLGVDLLWNAIGGIVSFFVLFDTFKWLYRYVDKALTLNGGDAGDVWGGL